jgi:hypothetical protein
MIIRRTTHFLHRNDKSIRRSSARLKHLSVNLLLAAHILLDSNLEALAASPYDSWYRRRSRGRPPISGKLRGADAQSFAGERVFVRPK